MSAIDKIGLWVVLWAVVLVGAMLVDMGRPRR